MSTTTIERSASPSALKSIFTGAIAGLGGGLVFGIMMGMQGMLPMVGMLVRQENAVVGFIVHMIISALIGASYGFIAPRLPSGWGTAVISGALYGAAWWVLGALVLMPLMLGMTQMVFVIGGPQIMSLVGHIVYGVITGVVFVPLSNRL